MALRCALNRAKAWSVNGAMSSFGRRYYHLPPPPRYDPDKPYQRHGGPCHAISDASEEFERALSSTRFAVNMFNECEGRNIKLVRLVRASTWRCRGAKYFLTIEGIDENGDRNVYYSSVSDSSSDCQKNLADWEVVDDEFKYPYSHDLKTCRPVEVRAYYRRHRPDYFRIVNKFEEHVGLSYHEFPNAVQMFNIMNLGEALHYALYAVQAQNEKWDIQDHNSFRLRKLVYASKEEIGAEIFYHLLLESDFEQTRELALNYALVKECEGEYKLIMWKEVDNKHGFFSSVYSAQNNRGA